MEVDTYKSVEKTLPWLERVARTADVALSDFSALTQRYDFTAEGQIAFGAHLDAVASKGGDPSGFMCFVWYVERQVRETAGKV